MSSIVHPPKETVHRILARKYMRRKKGKRLARACLPDKHPSPQLQHHREQAWEAKQRQWMDLSLECC